MIFALLLGLTLASGGVIQGTVRAEGSLEPVAGASVSIPDLGLGVVSDQHGYFVLSGVPKGRWRVESVAIGYRTHGLVVVSKGAGVIRLDFELATRPVELPSVTARAVAPSPGVAGSAPATAGPSAVRLNVGAAKLLPGLAEADVLRAVQMLPAVASASDFSSALYVRGGSPDQNLITLDGVPLFNPYHLGGLFGAITPDAVASVDLAAGAFPARTGDRLSSAISIATREGGRDRVRASGAVGLLSAHATVDGPLGGDGSFLFSARRTYLDAVTDAAYKTGLISVTMPYGFSDAYLKLSRDVGDLGRLTLSGYIDHESVHIPDRMTRDMDAEFAWGPRMLALNFRRPLGAAWLWEARAGYSAFEGSFRAWDDTGPDRTLRLVLDANTSMRDALLSTDLTRYASRHTLRAGAQTDTYLFRHRIEHDEEAIADLVSELSSTERLRTVALHVEDEWQATERLGLRGGLRVLGAGRLGTAWMPRVGARLQLSPSLTLSAGAGRSAQAIRSFRNEESVLASLIAYDLQTVNPEATRLATSDDAMLGVEWNTGRTSVRADVYAKRMDGLVLAPVPYNPAEAPVIVDGGLRVGEGSARGLEVLATHGRGGAQFSLAYTLNFLERTVDGRRITPRIERRHLLDATALLPWGRSGQFSARLALGTGQPFTPALGFAPHTYWDPAEEKWVERLDEKALFGDYNSERLPGYLRLDVAVRKRHEKQWFGRKITLNSYLQVVNVLNTRNVMFAEPHGTFPTVSYWPQLPILPTFGVEWKF